ncbi:carboxylating nicotinate-nucleotide diphosphorylase [Micromonospora olivasterospora]|uniref:Nicotinate-nucleotide pyrophosphorylase [carboxylating] n=1 Tax=Micromonospora olivasterospora TaxID=1880 RepID=A0A562I7G5_MICOL|nr:carboxylating nicotinate-nucleotide diphosphorylase [Micromonospora olivasterospora]TWH66960.1 nicotinate-nucleotide pyrophosphorylase [carboxylating] [Micromonospora olivasterospora]
MRESTEQALRAGGLDPAQVRGVIVAALAEDLGPDFLDVTSVATIPAAQTDTADLVARVDGVVAGLAVAAAVFELVGEVTGFPAGSGGAEAGATDVTTGGPQPAAGPVDAAPGAAVEVSLVARDGQRVARGDVLATVTGPTRLLLTAERTALNLLCRMSGVATHTRAWADALAGTKAMVLDTRKTTPGLRALEKYAVRAGGGTNKRMGLHDVAMIKDNHKFAAGGVAAAYRRVRETFPDVPVQVEVDTLAEAVEAVEAGADFLLLDNMSPATLKTVVAAVGERAELEATGGLTLDVAAAYAATGVDYLSVGALTHSSPILDIALDLRTE